MLINKQEQIYNIWTGLKPVYRVVDLAIGLGAIFFFVFLTGIYLVNSFWTGIIFLFCTCYICYLQYREMIK